MKNTVAVPALGESVVEARIAHWLKKEGDTVEIGDILVELETEKVNVEVAAQSAGVLTRITAPEGTTVHIGDTIAEVDSAAVPSSTKKEEREAESAENTIQRQDAKAQIRETADQIAGVKSREAERVTPVARRVAEQSGLNVSGVAGSGIGGRVTKHDVEEFLSNRDTRPRVAPQVQKPVNGKQQAPRPVSPDRTVREEHVKMSMRRRTIARRMVEAQQSAAMLTTFNEIDMSRVMELRKKYKDHFKEKYGISLGIVSFFVKAVIVALREFPRLNAEIDGEDIVYKYYYDIGVAIGAEEGLVVPVLRNAEQMSFAQIDLAVKDFAEKSAAGELTIEDLRGGTFTITNGGVFGSMMSTPILNPPQVGILGLHKIAERPVVENGQIVVRPMMYVALTYDHRIVDGRESVQFLVKVKEFIEDPAAMLLE